MAISKFITLSVFTLSLAFASTAHAQTTQTCQNKTITVPAGVSLACSATWQFQGTCDGTDQVTKWAIVAGTTTPGSWQITPWEPQAITLRGVELTKISGGPTQWFMAGNDFVPDAMGHMQPNSNYMLYMLPAGTGMPFPSIADATSTSYLDLHGACTGGASVTIWYTVIYTVP